MKRNIVAIVVALVVVISVYSSVPPLKLVPQGIFLPISPLYALVSNNISHKFFEQVNFYNPVMIPYTHKLLGYINIEYFSKEASPKEEGQIQRYVKQMAAQAMANGVVVTLFGHTIPGSVKEELSSYVFRGIAIRAIPNI